MCGIAGFQGDFERGLLERMSAAIAHRGPDGEGVRFVPGEGGAPPTGLAHRRLSILDLSPLGAQPMSVPCGCCGTSGDGEIVLNYNGEIYNFPELRREMEGRGHAFRSRTDSEILLHLYAEEGTAMLQRLNGIFAFAILDLRDRGRPEGVSRGTLFLARDPLGVKPLYYHESAQGVLFASEVKALLQHPGVSRELDAAAVHRTLAYLWTPAPATALAAVRKMEPGCAFLVTGGRVSRRWRYYELPYGGDRLDASPDEAAALLRDTLKAAVNRQMLSDVPVGAFLSGGLDSSAIVAMMGAGDARATRAYTISGVEDGNPEDLPYARAVADHLGVSLDVIPAQPDMFRHLERMLYHLDEPQADPAPINALLISERAREAGTKVLLSGAGGDDILSGYRRHAMLRWERVWGAIPGAVRRGVGAGARAVARGGTSQGGSTLLRRLLKVAPYLDADPQRRMISYFWWSSEEMRRDLYSPSFAERVGEVDTAGPLLDSLMGLPSGTDALDQMLFLETRHFLADHNLNYTDKMGMAAGVEVRVPLLDLEMVELAARLPSRYKQHGRTGKWIFRRAMEGALPHDVIHRPKAGFGAPLRRWLRHDLRETVDETLSTDALSRRGLFDPAAVRRLVELDRAGRIDGGYTIFSLLCIELWCRSFVDAATPTPP